MAPQKKINKFELDCIATVTFTATSKKIPLGCDFCVKNKI